MVFSMCLEGDPRMALGLLAFGFTDADGDMKTPDRVD